MNTRLTLTNAPHIHSGASTTRIMLLVVISLLPAMFISIYAYDLKAALHYAVAIFFSCFFEASFNLVTKRNKLFELGSLSDGSALVTGILVAMTIPAAAPLWISAVGSFIAIIIGKMLFGGLGGNPFNPALVSRVFLLISFPAQMTVWTSPVDAISGATTLGAYKMKLMSGQAITETASLQDLFLGLNSGSLGEVSFMALLLGGIILLATRVITWHIPVSFIGTVFLLGLILFQLDPERVLPPLVQVATGGLMLSAFFMATDYVTSPVTSSGKIIFGVGCGVITIVIRVFGSYPEGVAFAVLIMNAVTPLIDRYIRPKAYGSVK